MIKKIILILVNSNMQSSPYKCKICNMVFVNQEELLEHEVIVHVDQMLQCQSCNKVFANKEEFKNHEMEIHAGSQSSSNLSKKQQTSRSELGEDKESSLL
jgi:uncharacterized C2H2 Zn-finger protein